MTSTTKWWWNKKSNPKQQQQQPKSSNKQKSVASSLNGADEDASMFSLYSCGGESLNCPSTVHGASSIRAQHTKSEYSGNFSDVESNASILSKPWISRNMMAENKSIRDSIYEPKDEEDTCSIVSYAHSLPVSTSLHDDTIEDSKRRGSIVDYIVNKPLHGKLKVIIITNAVKPLILISLNI